MRSDSHRLARWDAAVASYIANRRTFGRVYAQEQWILGNRAQKACSRSGDGFGSTSFRSMAQDVPALEPEHATRPRDGGV